MDRDRNWYGNINTVEYEFLAQFKDGGAPAHYGDTWAFLRSGMAQGLVRTDSEFVYGMPARMKDLRQKRYLGIFRAREAQLPELTEEAFVSGHWDGWLVIYDLETWKPACQTRIVVGNSEVVRWKEDGLFGTDAEGAIRKDFEDNFEDVTKTALKGITSELEVWL